MGRTDDDVCYSNIHNLPQAVTRKVLALLHTMHFKMSPLQHNVIEQLRHLVFTSIHLYAKGIMWVYEKNSIRRPERLQEVND